MVAVTIDRPVREYHVGVFGSQKPGETLIVGAIHNSAAVILARENGASLQNSTGVLRFRGADVATAVEAWSAAETLAAIQIQEHQIVPEFAIARNRPGAAAFWIAGVAPRNDYFQPLCGRLCQKGQRRD